MAIVDRERRMNAMPPELEVEQDVDLDVPEDYMEGAEIEELEDGSVALTPAGMATEAGLGVDLAHDVNLAEILDDRDLDELSSELIERFEEDLQSRKDWEETYTKGIDLLGVKREDTRSRPFEGASAVTHPLIAESIVQFQAQAYKELLPAKGPVQAKIMGAKTPEVEAQAKRVENYMNYQITEVMEEFNPDLDQMLFFLPISGSTFKKVYFDPALGRQKSEFVQAQDIVVPYGAKSLADSPRITHVVKEYDNEIRKAQVAGVYRDVALVDPVREQDDVVDKMDELEGRDYGHTNELRTLLEMHVELDLVGFEHMDANGEPTGIKLPYIVTIDKDSSKILSIQRNWKEADANFRRNTFFVHYKFMPGLGFYGFGLIHLIGNLGRSVTSILRQLLDAGTLANLPSGFKAKGVRLRDHDEPLQPGEFRDIDAPGGSLRDAIMPLPYKEPSATLANLLGVLVESGRRFVSVVDEKASNLNTEAPVGTTLALLERGTQVISAIHKRLHYAQHQELKLLANIIGTSTPAAYEYTLPSGAPAEIKKQDFDGRVDIIPVSDPNAFSMAQRIAMAQTGLQLAQSNPQIHDLREAYVRMYQAIGMEDVEKLLPPPPQPQPKDPAMENAAMIQMQPAQAFPGQDHEAHIEAHLQLIQMTVVGITPAILSMVTGHVFNHVSFWAREMVEEEVKQIRSNIGALAGKQLGDAVDAGQMEMDQAMVQLQQLPQQVPQYTPEQVEARVAQKANEIMAQLLPRLQPPGAQEGDPLVKIRMQELSIKDKELELKRTEAERDAALEQQRLMQKTIADQGRIDAQNAATNARTQVARERIDAMYDLANNKRNESE